jgi:hypothetical protein
MKKVFCPSDRFIVGQNMLGHALYRGPEFCFSQYGLHGYQKTQNFPNLRGTCAENVKKAQNQPTLMSSTLPSGGCGSDDNHFSLQPLSGKHNNTLYSYNNKLRSMFWPIMIRFRHNTCTII